MKIHLYVSGDPATAAALLRERAMLRLRGEVYVQPHVRRWPGGKAKALRSKLHRNPFAAIRPDAVLTKIMQTHAAALR